MAILSWIFVIGLLSLHALAEEVQPISSLSELEKTYVLQVIERIEKLNKNSISGSCMQKKWENLANLTPKEILCRSLTSSASASGSAEDIGPCELVMSTYGFTRSRLDWCSQIDRERHPILRKKISLLSSEKLKRMSPDEFRTRDKRLIKIFEQTGKSCCGGDSICEQHIENIPVSNCKYEDDDFGEDSKCGGIYSGIVPDVSGYRNIIDNGKWLTRSGESFPKTENDIRFLIGTFQVSTWVKVGSDNKLHYLETDSIVAHEVAHACDMIKLQLNTYRQERLKLQPQVSSLARALGDYKSCSESPDLIAHYQELFSTTGVSNGYFSCLNKAISSSKSGTTDISACEGQCNPRQYQEAFGRTYEILDIANGDSEEALSKLIFLCMSPRHQNYPLGSDVLKCGLANIPDLNKKLVRALSCGEQ